MNPSKKQLILSLLEKSETELFPKQISRETGIKHATVKKYLRDLLAQNKILQPYKGAYCSRIAYGMIVVPLRCHHVILSVNAPWLGFSDEVREVVGDVVVRLQFGLERRRVTVRLSCDGGMDYRTLLFALNRAYDLFEGRTGRKVEEVVVKCFELNRDFHGVRVDGAKCYTRKGFFDFIDRVYQKDRSTVRAETVITREMTVDQLQTLVQGGVPSFEISQGVFVLAQKVDKLAEAIRFQNQVIQGLMNEMIKIKEKMEKT